jgi:hypothetical protein
MEKEVTPVIIIISLRTVVVVRGPLLRLIARIIVIKMKMPLRQRHLSIRSTNDTTLESIRVRTWKRS